MRKIEAFCHGCGSPIRSGRYTQQLVAYYEWRGERVDHATILCARCEGDRERRVQAVDRVARAAARVAATGRTRVYWAQP